MLVLTAPGRGLREVSGNLVTLVSYLGLSTQPKWFTFLGLGFPNLQHERVEGNDT